VIGSFYYVVISKIGPRALTGALLQRPVLGLVLGCFLSGRVVFVEQSDHFDQVLAGCRNLVLGLLGFEFQGFDRFDLRFLLLDEPAACCGLSIYPDRLSGVSGFFAALLQSLRR